MLDYTAVIEILTLDFWRNKEMGVVIVCFVRSWGGVFSFDWLVFLVNFYGKGGANPLGMGLQREYLTTKKGCMNLGLGPKMGLVDFSVF